MITTSEMKSYQGKNPHTCLLVDNNLFTRTHKKARNRRAFCYFLLFFEKEEDAGDDKDSAKSG